jgi:hypothetical protein
MMGIIGACPGPPFDSARLRSGSAGSGYPLQVLARKASFRAFRFYPSRGMPATAIKTQASLANAHAFFHPLFSCFKYFGCRRISNRPMITIAERSTR